MRTSYKLGDHVIVASDGLEPIEGFITDFRNNKIVVSDRNLNELVTEDEVYVARLKGLHLSLYTGKRIATINRSKSTVSTFQDIKGTCDINLKNIIVAGIPDLNDFIREEEVEVNTLDPLTTAIVPMRVKRDSIVAVNKKGFKEKAAEVLKGTNRDKFIFQRYAGKVDFDRVQTYFIIPKCTAHVTHFNSRSGYFEASVPFSDKQVKLSKYLIEKRR